MMPQEEISSAQHQQANSDYGRYAGNQTSSTRQHYSPDLREEPSGKIYPQPRDNAKIFQLVLPLICLAFLLLFGLLFVVIVGGTAGWISFAAACFVIACVLAYSASLQMKKE